MIHLDSARIQGRRRFIFQYLSQQLSATQMHPLINKAFPCSLSTVQRDIRKIRDWLPGLMNIREGEGDQAFARLVGILRVAQEIALQLCSTADNSNAKVGSLRALALAVKAEADLRMDTGGIVRTPFKLEHLRTIDLEGFDEAAIAAIVQNFMNDERMRARRMVEPFDLSGDTVVEPVEDKTPSQPLTFLDGVTAPRPDEQGTGCDRCRLWEKSCAGPQDGDLDDMGKCVHIQPWIRNGIRGLSV